MSQWDVQHSRGRVRVVDVHALRRRIVPNRPRPGPAVCVHTLPARHVPNRTGADWHIRLSEMWRWHLSDGLWHEQACRLRSMSLGLIPDRIGHAGFEGVLAVWHWHVPDRHRGDIALDVCPVRGRDVPNWGGDTGGAQLHLVRGRHVPDRIRHHGPERLHCLPSRDVSDWCRLTFILELFSMFLEYLPDWHSYVFSK